MKIVILTAVFVAACVLLIILINRYDAFKNWLVYAVSESEKVFGGGTGKLKLRYAYDLAIKTFPVIAKFISWERFSKCVDEALDLMRDMIKHNKNIDDILNGD